MSDLVGIVHFLAVEISDIENIHDLIDIGGNFGHPDIEPAAEQGIRDAEEQARKIFGEDFHNRKETGGLIVDLDPLRAVHGRGPGRAVAFHPGLQATGQLQLAF